MLSRRRREALQVLEQVRRDEAPELCAVALLEGVEHSVVGPRDQHLGPRRICRLERLVAGVFQGEDRRRDQDRRRMEDVAELPGPIFRSVAILILVVDVDAPDEVDDLVVREAGRDAEEGRRDSAVGLGEWRDASADLRIDRPVR